MLIIRKTVLHQLEQTFKSCDVEQGFILGCSSRLELIDSCCQIPALQAGMYYYYPNTSKADEIINNWAKQGICFCGFIHSHVVKNYQLSFEDIEFTKKLFQTYKLPIMWFGIGVVLFNSVDLCFYRVQERNDSFIDITKETIECFG